MDDVDVRKDQGGVFKAFKLVGGHKRKDRRPSIGDKLGDGNVVFTKNFQNDFVKGEPETML